MTTVCDDDDVMHLLHLVDVGVQARVHDVGESQVLFPHKKCNRYEIIQLWLVWWFMKIIFSLLDKSLSTTKMRDTRDIEESHFWKILSSLHFNLYQTGFFFLISCMTRYIDMHFHWPLKYSSLNSNNLCLNLKHVIFFQNNKHSNWHTAITNEWFCWNQRHQTYN